MAFKPAVQAPSSAPINWKKMNPEEFHDAELEVEVSEILAKDYVQLWYANANLKTVTEKRK